MFFISQSLLCSSLNYVVQLLGRFKSIFFVGFLFWNCSDHRLCHSNDRVFKKFSSNKKKSNQFFLTFLEHFFLKCRIALIIFLKNFLFKIKKKYNIISVRRLWSPHYNEGIIVIFWIWYSFVLIKTFSNWVAAYLCTLYTGYTVIICFIHTGNNH